ncbi:hypothetical protein AVEN_137856-1 [Araneus ventricosus]|uniref:Uncharacterized protein n=1 Tax=Araneus ventricosus TaxID=182803 RepID=A0A4Y2UDL0_ARAVE|nr:hypothetical protein AVEN_137856-1 [Araneus ventricosus]
MEEEESNCRLFTIRCKQAPLYPWQDETAIYSRIRRRISRFPNRKCKFTLPSSKFTQNKSSILLKAAVLDSSLSPLPLPTRTAGKPTEGSTKGFDRTPISRGSGRHKI